MRVKICGITRLDQARAIAGFGATDLGFICVPQSPRYLNSDQLAAITQPLLAEQVAVGTVGVFVNWGIDHIVATVHKSGIKSIQLHGQETLQDCAACRQALPQVEIIKAIRVRHGQDLELAHHYAPLVNALLLDAYHPHQYGGTGKTLDWESLSSFRPSCPWLLAGGLNPQNVKTALQRVSPDGIDLSSGVEQSPGVKDLDRVRDLFTQLRPVFLPGGG
jgi:phosphoribosylanthranilate isomerase